MSTILDSLKKSSNKRDDHNNNSMDNFKFSSENNSSKSGFFMFLFLIIVTAVILYFGYQFINNQPGSSTSVANESAPNVQIENSFNNNVSKTEPVKNLQAKKLEKPNSKTVQQELVASQVKLKQAQSNQTIDTNNDKKVDRQNTQLVSSNNRTEKKVIQDNTIQSRNQNRFSSPQIEDESPVIKLNVTNEKNPPSHPQITPPHTPTHVHSHRHTQTYI